jgi:hypothetical protein
VVTIKHSKVSSVPDGGDTSLVRPSDWNADHDVTGSLGVTVSDTHGHSISDVTEIHFGTLWVTDLGSGVVSIDTYAALSFPTTWTYAGLTYDGVFNTLGVIAGGGTFANPAGQGHLTTTQSSDVDGSRPASKATDHSLDPNSGCSHTQSIANSWWKADFQSGHTFTPTHLAIVGRNGGGQQPRNFNLQGSNDNSSWTDLLVVVNDGPADNGWWESAVTGAAAYQYLRIYETGTNSSGANYLVLGEVEFWGTLA